MNAIRVFSAATVLLSAALLLPPPAVASASDCPQSDIFERLACEQDVEDARLALDIKRGERRRLAAMSPSGGAPKEQSGFPELIRIYGPANAVVAQFQYGGSRFNAGPGDDVAAGWRVASIASNGVVLTHTNGDRRTVQMGNDARPLQPISQPPSGAAAQAPTPHARMIPPLNSGS